jgi:hypothetical protein
MRQWLRLLVMLGATGLAGAQTPQAPASLLQAPPSPAVLSLSGGKLAILARNSSLRATLHSLQSMTGAKIDGIDTVLGGDERIFGVYGPGDPQQVLSELLDACGYNSIIAGRQANGAPREIVLSKPSSLPAQPAGAQPVRADESDSEPGYSGYTDTTPQPPVPQPGAHPGVPQPRTAQEMLQELERMRQQAIPGNSSQDQ